MTFRFKDVPLYCILFTVCPLGFAATYKSAKPITLGGSGGWDYLAADSASRRLYVSHGTEVDVVDLDSHKAVGKITGLGGVHGIAVADDLHTGFISDGRNNEVVAFDLKSLAVKEKVKTGTNPDGILYDAATQHVFAFNGRSNDATSIDAKTMKVDATIALGGKPEFPVSDGKGSVYVNIEDTSEIVQIDAKSLQAKARWSVKPCESPSGLAIDTEGRRLFAVCDNKVMAVVDADSGKVVATPAIGDGPDAASYDPGTRLAFASNGDGTVTVVRQAGKDQYEVAETVKTEKGARTMTLDTKTHRIYLSAADYGPAPAATADRPHPRPAVLPGTFRVLVFEGPAGK